MPAHAQRGIVSLVELHAQKILRAERTLKSRAAAQLFSLRAEEAGDTTRSLLTLVSGNPLIALRVCSSDQGIAQASVPVGRDRKAARRLHAADLGHSPPSPKRGFLLVGW